MPIMEGPLRIAINDWITTNPIAIWLSERGLELIDRQERIIRMLEGVYQQAGILGLTYVPLFAFQIAVYMISGNDTLLKPLLLMSSASEVQGEIDKYAKFWQQAFAPKPGVGLIEGVGTIVSEPILSAIGAMAEQPGESPEAHMRRVYGVLSTIILAPSLAVNAAEVLGLGQVETPAETLATLFEALGISTIGAMTAAPMMESGIVPQMKRSLRKRYRPRRFAVSDLRDLYALGEIGPEEFLEEGRQQGWRDQDLAKWARLAFKQPPESDLWTMYNDGLITATRMISALRAKGYASEWISNMFEINRKPDTEESLLVTKTTAKRAFREGLMSEAEFRQTLSALKLADAEIDLLIALEREGQRDDVRSLTVSQLKAAWSENVLSDVEVRHYLAIEGFQETETNLLLSTWQKQIEPEFRKVNKSTVLAAYTAGVLSRVEAANKLHSIGYAPEDATLELDLAEVRNPAAFARPAAKPARSIAPGKLDNLLVAGLIDAQAMFDRLVAAGYTADDADLLTRASVAKAAEGGRMLGQSDVEDAYLLGIMSRAQALQALIGLDYTEADGTTVLEILEQSNPAVFFPESVQSVRVPTVSALVEALRLGIIDDSQFYARTAELGMSHDDAEIYLTIARTSERKKVKTLTKSDIGSAYKSGIMSWNEAMTRLVSQGYNDQDANIILTLRRPDISTQDIWHQVMAGQIDAEIGFMQLVDMGYTGEEIEAAMAELEH